MELVDVVGKFYEAAANPQVWPDALEALSTLTGCRGALLTTRVFIPGGLVHTTSLKEAAGQFFDEGWYLGDVRNAAVRPRHFWNGFFSDHTLFSESEMEKSEYYEKFARKADVPWFAAGRLIGELTDGAVSLSLQRSAKEGPFTPDEISRLNALLPRLTPTMILASRLAEIKGKSLIDGLSLVKQPAILLKMDGAVSCMNASAEALLGKRLKIRRSRLSAFGTSENRQLQALIDQACTGQGRHMSSDQHLAPVVLPETDTEARLIVTAAPIRRSACDIIAFSGVILMITDFSSNLRPAFRTLQHVFNLTRREAEIMSLIGEGQSIQQIGSTLGIATETVRHHVKSVFTKTHTSKQSDVVRLYLRMSALTPD